MINTSISGMMSSSSHILCLYDFTLPFKIRKKKHAIAHLSRSHDFTDLRMQFLTCERMIFRQQGAVEDHIREKEDRNTNTNTTPTIQWFLQNEDSISKCKSTVVTELG